MANQGEGVESGGLEVVAGAEVLRSPGVVRDVALHRGFKSTSAQATTRFIVSRSQEPTLPGGTMYQLIPLFVFLVPTSFLEAQDKKPPAQFEIRVLIVELGPERMPEFDTTQDRKQIENMLVGPEHDIAEKLKEPMRKGLVASTRLLRYHAVEGQRFSSGVNERRKFPSDAMRALGKVVSTIVTTDTSMGIDGNVKAGDDGSASLDLFYSERRAYPSLVFPRGKDGKRDETAEQVQITRFVAYMAKSKLSIPAGQAVPVPDVGEATWNDEGRIQELKSELARIVVLVSASRQ